MAAVDRSMLVNFSARQMYALIGDVESYPQFLPDITDGLIDAFVRRAEAIFGMK